MYISLSFKVVGHVLQQDVADTFPAATVLDAAACI